MIFPLVGLKLIFLVVTRAVSVLGLSRREAWWKDAEILMVRHQLAGGAARAAEGSFAPDVGRTGAWLTLLAGTLPGGRLAGLRPDRGPRPRSCAGIETSSAAAGAGLSRRGTVRSSAGAPRCAVGGAPAGAGETSRGGYRRIHGELARLGIIVAPSTVVADPQERRDRPGAAAGTAPGGRIFLRSRAQGILALDFFTAEPAQMARKCTSLP